VLKCGILYHKTHRISILKKELQNIMMASTHILTGVSIAFAAQTITPANDIVTFTAVMMTTIAGSLLPDIDHHNSWIGRRAWPLSIIIQMGLRHRGAVHSLLGALVTLGVAIGICLFLNFSMVYAYYFFIGYLGHLFGDCLTNSGVPLFWPIKKKVRFPVTFATGTWQETIFSMLLGGFVMWQGYNSDLLGLPEKIWEIRGFWG
jgi:inner membrane protein